MLVNQEREREGIFFQNGERERKRERGFFGTSASTSATFFDERANALEKSLPDALANTLKE